MREISRHESKECNNFYAYFAISMISQKRLERNILKNALKMIINEGIPIKHCGFRYIIKCICIICRYGVDGLLITKDVYPVVAREFGVSVHSVESSIRRSISEAWKSRSIKNHSGDHAFMPFTDKPSNSEFLYYISWKLIASIQKETGLM